MQQSASDSSMEFSTSKLYMWRCVVAMAHADDLIHTEEVKWLHQVFDNMKSRAGMSEEQEQILLNDIKEKQDIGQLLSHINDPQYRGQVVYFARLLAFKDGDIDPSEEKLLEKLHTAVTEGVDFEAIRKEVFENVSSEMIAHELEMDAQRPMTGLYGLIDKLALHYGIDLMDE